MSITSLLWLSLCDCRRSTVPGYSKRNCVDLSCALTPRSSQQVHGNTVTVVRLVSMTSSFSTNQSSSPSITTIKALISPKNSQLNVVDERLKHTALTSFVYVQPTHPLPQYIHAYLYIYMLAYTLHLACHMHASGTSSRDVVMHLFRWLSASNCRSVQFFWLPNR